MCKRWKLSHTPCIEEGKTGCKPEWETWLCAEFRLGKPCENKFESWERPVRCDNHMHSNEDFDAYHHKKLAWNESVSRAVEFARKSEEEQKLIIKGVKPMHWKE